MTVPLILASGSAIRRAILSSAGLSYEIIRPDVDEAVVKASGLARGDSLQTIAADLADAKALAIDAPADALVIGSDQILEFKGEGFDKPASMSEARARLLRLQGETHALINSVSVARRGAVVWRNLDIARLSMRPMAETEIDAYLARAGEDILSSVGAYQVEKLGARLFDRIEGDYFTVLGLSLFPLLSFLRHQKAIAF